VWNLQVLISNNKYFKTTNIYFSFQAVYSMDCPRTVLVDLVHEDGKFYFRAEGVPDLEVDPQDLVKYNKIMVH
jgi:hypothetical protein